MEGAQNIYLGTEAAEGGPPGVSADSSYENVAENVEEADAEDEEEMAAADLFGSSGAENEAGEAGDMPEPVQHPTMVDRVCVDDGAAALKLMWFFEALGGEKGLSCVAVRHATSGELLVAVPGSFRPRPALPLTPSGRQPRGTVDGVSSDGSRAPGSLKVPVAFVILSEDVFADRGVFFFEDVAESMEEHHQVLFGGRHGLWPDCGQVVALAEALGFGDGAGDGWQSAVSGAEGLASPRIIPKGKSKGQPPTTARAKAKPKASSPSSIDGRVTAMEVQLSEVVSLLKEQARAHLPAAGRGSGGPPPEADPLGGTAGGRGRAEALQKAQDLLAKPAPKLGGLPRSSMSAFGRGGGPGMAGPGLQTPKTPGVSWLAPASEGADDDAVDPALESAMLFREMRQELKAERIEREKSAQKRKKVFGLSLADEGDEGDDADRATLAGTRGITGMELLKGSFLKEPELFARAMEARMSKKLDEFPSEVGATPESMVGIRYVTTYMPVGGQQAVGRMVYALAQIHRALCREKFWEARFLVLITLAAADQQCLDGNWLNGWNLTPFNPPPWDVWKTINLAERQKSQYWSPLYDPSWMSMVAAKLKEEEQLLKKRGGPGFDPSKQRDKNTGDKGDGKGK